VSPNRPPSTPRRFLGIDHGTRRVGLASGDELGLASPLPALTQATPAQRWQALSELIRQRRITDLVLGHPLNMDDTVGPKAKEVEAFAEELRTAFGLPVHLVDERLTSHEAESAIPPAQRRAIRERGLVDSRAAALILQDFLDQHFPPPLVPPEEMG
jgi:putative holliday junction resolvase